MDQVEEVKNKSDIVSVIGEHLKLTKAGRNYKALCPFHPEKTPSFMVNPELQIFKCFGCGESGDVISFLQKHEGMEFYEALKFLADRAGIKLKPMKGRGAGQRETLIAINETAAKFYHYILLKHKAGQAALEYLLKDRKLTRQTIEIFTLGFAPPKGSPLYNFLIDKKGFAKEEMVRSGVVGSTSGRVYDRFSGRVIFPQFDHRGNAVALAGRVLPGEDKRAKYINSPESPVYQKSKVLYGLNIARSEVKRRKSLILVEGELDMISSYQAGVRNVAAIKGTALTQDHVLLVSRLAEEIIFALDADLAGDKAARRGISLAQAAGLEVKVASMKGYKDPDDFVKKDPKGFRKAIAEPIGVYDFMIDSIVAQYKKSGASKGKVGRELMPILAEISDSIVKAQYAQKVAKILDVPMEAVLDELKKVRSKTAPPRLEVFKKEQKKEKDRRQLLEEWLLVLFFQSDSKKKKDVKFLDLVKDPLLVKIIKKYKQTKNFKLKKFVDSLPEELKSGFADLLMQEPGRDTIDKVAMEITKIDLHKSLEEMGKKISVAEQKGDKKVLQKLNSQFAHASAELAKLNGSTV